MHACAGAGSLSWTSDRQQHQSLVGEVQHDNYWDHRVLADDDAVYRPTSITQHFASVCCL